MNLKKPFQLGGDSFYRMNTLDVSVEFPACFKQLFAVLTPILFWVHVTCRRVKTRVVLRSLDRRESLLANGTLFALRMALIDMGRNLTETGHGSGTQLAETLNSISLCQK
jgi:hypothetical protein